MVSLIQIFERNVTISATHTTPKSTSSGGLTFDEKVVVHRVFWQNLGSSRLEREGNGSTPRSAARLWATKESVSGGRDCLTWQPRQRSSVLVRGLGRGLACEGSRAERNGVWG